MAYSILTADTLKHKHLAETPSKKTIGIVGAKARQVVALIENNLPVPETVIITGADSQESIDQLLPKVTGLLAAPYIVRSSTNQEDSQTASFAGQFLSVPDIKDAKGLAQAMWDVAHTKPSGTVNDIPAGAPIHTPTTLLVQEYKTPKISGVVFTESPENNKEMIIEYSDRAHGVTAATTSPERLVLNRSDPQIPASAPAIIEQLAGYALAIEKLFKTPQDIEWIYDGKLWIVQSRPITTISSPAQTEINRLNDLFGEHAPQLSAQQFIEGMQSSTPITQSLFRQFFAEDGSWGKFLKRYRIPHRHYSVETYLPSAFDRLYINKDEERRILYTDLNNKPGSNLTSRFVDSPEFSRLLHHPLLSLRQILAATRLNISTYYHYNRFEKNLPNNQLPSEATIVSLEFMRKRLVEDTVMRLFRVTAFRDCSLNILHQRIHRHVGPELWEQLLRPAQPSFITGVLRNVTNKADLVEQLGHRGSQELELSQPRWSEDQSELPDLYNPGSSISKSLDDADLMRQSVINRFASSWDKQMVETHFLLYDYFYACRERAHDLWIRDLTGMRHILLQLDKDAGLGGLIWYAELDEIFSLYPGLDVVKLKRRHDMHAELAAIELPPELEGENWSSLPHSNSQAQSTEGLPVNRLVGGQASGITGTIEDLKNGKPVQILLVKSLDPGLVIYFNQIKGIVTEAGGLLSHGTILAREAGIPVVYLPRATSILDNNTQITMNATEERLDIMASQTQAQI
jgi:phosphohistidine swiveling domain-containing protein